MRKSVIVLWLLGCALVVSDLHYCFEPFCCGLLVCYSLPFAVMAMVRIPQRPSAQRYALLAAFALVLAVNLYIPVRHFLPGYHPKALEQVGYMFLPVIELGLIGLFFLVGAAVDLLLRKDAKP
ncbi:MAG: hypothetical protein ABSH46_23165 [Bryobacteraceae bacterium]